MSFRTEMCYEGINFAHGDEQLHLPSFVYSTARPEQSGLYNQREAVAQLCYEFKILINTPAFKHYFDIGM